MLEISLKSSEGVTDFMFMVFLSSCFKRCAALLRCVCVCVFKQMHILEISSSDSPAVLLEEKDEALQEVSLALSGDLLVGLCEKYLA